MRNLKWLAALAIVAAITLLAFARDASKTKMFAKTEELVHTTAVVSENELYDGSETAPADFSNAQVEAVFMGQCHLAYTTEDGKEISVKFDYGLRRYPENGQVSVMYDKAHPKRVSLEGFDHYNTQKSGLMLLGAAICLGLGLILCVLAFISHLAQEHRIYKKEQKIYGRDLSGFKAVFGFKIFAMLLFTVSILLIVLPVIKIASIVNTIPIANDDMCGFVDAPVTKNADGSTSYTFTAPDGTQITRQMNALEIMTAENNTAKVRYLLSDPNQNSSDIAFVYFGQATPLAVLVGAGCILLCLVPFFIIVIIALGMYNKRAVRRKGYVDYFKITREDIDRMMQDDE